MKDGRKWNEETKEMNRGKYTRLVKELRPQNTPSLRDSMMFEVKDVLKK